MLGKVIRYLDILKMPSLYSPQKSSILTIVIFSRYTLFGAHPVLGSIMAVVALEDLEPGEEVFTNYGYKDEAVYRGLNIK